MVICCVYTINYIRYSMNHSVINSQWYNICIHSNVSIYVNVVVGGVNVSITSITKWQTTGSIAVSSMTSWGVNYESRKWCGIMNAATYVWVEIGEGWGCLWLSGCHNVDFTLCYELDVSNWNVNGWRIYMYA